MSAYDRVTGAVAGAEVPQFDRSAAEVDLQVVVETDVGAPPRHLGERVGLAKTFRERLAFSRSRSRMLDAFWRDDTITASAPNATFPNVWSP